MKTLVLESLEEIQKWQRCLPFDASSFVHQSAAAHVLVVENDDVEARCSVWISTQEYENKKLGIIGHYAAKNNDAAMRVLDTACDWLKKQKCEIAIGPMDGNTWRNYRFVTEAGSHSPFFLEPQNPMQYPQQFQKSGFQISARYSSVLCDDLTHCLEHLGDVETRLTQDGVTIRSLQMENWEEELRRIYEVCDVSFARNFLYEPIGWNEFLAQYSAIKNFVVPELIFIAECENRPVGFSFSYPDFLQQQRGENGNTIVVKTVAVLPGRRFAGLGNLLAEKTHGMAYGMGFRRAIHALIYDGNASRNVSTRYGETMRRYAIFARDLGL